MQDLLSDLHDSFRLLGMTLKHCKTHEDDVFPDADNPYLSVSFEIDPEKPHSQLLLARRAFEYIYEKLLRENNAWQNCNVHMQRLSESFVKFYATPIKGYLHPNAK